MALFKPNPSGNGGSGGGTTDTGSLLLTASFSFPNLVFTKGDGSAFNVNISASATLQQDLTSNVTVGGSDAGTLYPSGTLLEDILRDILIDNFPAEVSLDYLILNTKGVPVGIDISNREISSSITFNSASIASTPRSPGGAYPVSASFTASGADTGNFDVYLNNGPLAASTDYGLGIDRTVNRSSSGSITFRVNAIEPVDLTTITSTLTVNYLYPMYYGMTATDYSTTGNVDGALTKLLEAKGTKSVLMSGTNAFIYFAYPTSYGNLTSIKDSNQFEYLNVPTPAFTKYTRTQSGSAWSAISYNIYKYTANLPNGTTSNQNFTFTF